jgi:hypothetical protein
MSWKRGFVIALGLASLAFAATALAVVTITVTPDNPNGWSWKKKGEACSGSPTGRVAFVNGPGTPPLGSGSLRLTTGTNGDAYIWVRTNAFKGVKLSDLKALYYSTYITGKGPQAPYLDVYVDWNDDGVRNDIVTYEPVYNTDVDGDPVTQATWQTWDALKGEWWSDGSGGPPPFYTLSQYETAHPNATILKGGFRISAGCGGAPWANFTGYVDRLHSQVGSQESRFYDFEP